MKQAIQTGYLQSPFVLVHDASHWPGFRENFPRITRMAADNTSVIRVIRGKD